MYLVLKFDCEQIFSKSSKNNTILVKNIKRKWENTNDGCRFVVHKYKEESKIFIAGSLNTLMVVKIQHNNLNRTSLL